MSVRAFVIHPADNVATLLAGAEKGGVELCGAATGTVTALESIAAAHKVAIRPIPQGEPVLKFGWPIGRASRDIAPGEWVHLHNCESNYDERSGGLDVETGVPSDTLYV